MKWVSVSIQFVKSVEAAELTHSQIGIWTRLQCYCGAQENGGVLVGAKSLSDKLKVWGA